jgi:hypothetical protein
VTRLQFALILSAGYAGPSREALSAHLDRGAAATLAMQSVSGEIPYGGRSNQFLHNDSLFAALCEWYAARFRARGDLKMAARFRLAAAHAVEGLRRWLAERPVRHVKNRYPTGTGKRGTGIGCESYAYFDKYMVTMGSWAVVARRFADHSPLLEAGEPGTTAFEPAPHFHAVCLRAGDYTAQFDYNAQAEYDCDGLGRVHRRGAPPTICMSVPCPAGETVSYSTETPYGKVRSSVSHDGQKVTVEVQVPVGAHATVYVPKSVAETAAEPLDDARYEVHEVGSGTYRFTSGE